MSIVKCLLLYDKGEEFNFGTILDKDKSMIPERRLKNTFNPRQSFDVLSPFYQ